MENCEHVKLLLENHQKHIIIFLERAKLGEGESSMGGVGIDLEVF